MGLTRFTEQPSDTQYVDLFHFVAVKAIVATVKLQ